MEKYILDGNWLRTTMCSGQSVLWNSGISGRSFVPVVLHETQSDFLVENLCHIDNQDLRGQFNNGNNKINNT